MESSNHTKGQGIIEDKKKPMTLTDPVIQGSPFNHHVGSNLIRSPSTSTNSGESRKTNRICFTTELVSFSWLVA